MEAFWILEIIDEPAERLWLDVGGESDSQNTSITGMNLGGKILCETVTIKLLEITHDLSHKEFGVHSRLSPQLTRAAAMVFNMEQQAYRVVECSDLVGLHDF